MSAVEDSNSTVHENNLEDTKIVKWVTSFDEARQVISEFETITRTKFIKRWCKEYDIAKSFIHWEEQTNIPYILLKTTTLECQHAKDRNKERNEKRKLMKGPSQLKSPQAGKKICILGSKKVDCKATVKIMSVMKFPRFQVEKLTSYTRETTRKSIRKALDADSGDLEKVYGCFVIFPTYSAHTGHVVGQKCVKGYNESVPLFLRHRSRKIVKHCMKRFAQTDEMSNETIFQDGNVFYIKNDAGDVCTVYFGNTDTSPKCTCPDFHKDALPCKHMFAIFKIYPDLSAKEMSTIIDNALTANPARFEDKQNMNESQEYRDIVEVVIPDFDVKVEVIDSPRKQSVDNIYSLLGHIETAVTSVTSEEVLRQTESNLAVIFQSLNETAQAEAEAKAQKTKRKPVKRRRTKDQIEVSVSNREEIPVKFVKVNRYTKAAHSGAQLKNNVGN